MAAKHPNVERTHLTPRLVCEQLGVGIETVLGWIHTGNLRAANISNSNTRPRWRVAKSDLQDFLDRRCNQQPSPKKPAKRRKPRKEFV